MILLLTTIISLALLVCCLVSALRTSPVSAWTRRKTRLALGILAVVAGGYLIVHTAIVAFILIGALNGVDISLPEGGPAFEGDYGYALDLAGGILSGAAVGIIAIVADVVFALDAFIGLATLSAGVFCIVRSRKGHDNRKRLQPADQILVQAESAFFSYQPASGAAGIGGPETTQATATTKPDASESEAEGARI